MLSVSYSPRKQLSFILIVYLLFRVTLSLSAMALIFKNYDPISTKFGSKKDPIRVPQPTTRRQNADESNGLVTCQLDNRVSSNKPSSREKSDWKNSPEPAAHTEVFPIPEARPSSLEMCSLMAASPHRMQLHKTE